MAQGEKRGSFGKKVGKNWGKKGVYQMAATRFSAVEGFT